MISSAWLKKMSKNRAEPPLLSSEKSSVKWSVNYGNLFLLGKDNGRTKFFMYYFDLL